MEHEKSTQNASPVKALFRKIGETREVNMVYGDPVKMEHKVVIPAAKMRYFVGGGGGNDSSSGGEGGGGYISVKPVGVYEVTENRTTFKPAYDLKSIAGVILAATALISWMFRKISQ